MITFERLLEEVKFYQYSAQVLVRYNTNKDLNLGSEKLAELIRGLPGATKVSTISSDKEKGIVIFNVRTVSQKSPKDCFIALKKNALLKFKGSILDVKIGAGSIETRNFIK